MPTSGKNVGIAVMTLGRGSRVWEARMTLDFNSGAQIVAAGTMCDGVMGW